MKKILLALLAFSLCFAADPAQPIKFENIFPDYAALVVALLAIGILLTGIVYMAGSFLMNDKVKMWAKNEAVEIFYSGVILVMVVGAVSSAQGVADSLTAAFDPTTAALVCNTGPNAIPAFNQFTINGQDRIDSGYNLLPCHMRVAKNFLATLFYETAGFVKTVGIVHSWYTYLSSFSIDFTPVGTTTFFSGGAFSHALFGFLNTKNNALQFLFENGVKILTMVRFQEILLNFIAIAMFPVLLASGLVLRTFMLTRRLGGLLMAIAFSLYFVYPIFYVMGDGILNAVASQNPQNPGQYNPILASLTYDVSALPPKFTNSQLPAMAESNGINTNAMDVSQNFLAQLGSLTSATNCQDQLDTIKKMEAGGTVATDDTKTQSALDLFGSDNKMLGSWLDDAYTKGGPTFLGMHSANKFNTSFTSILVGIDVLAKALFFSMFFSFLAIFATIASIKSLSPMLGGDVEIAGLTHLI